MMQRSNHDQLGEAESSNELRKVGRSRAGRVCRSGAWILAALQRLHSSRGKVNTGGTLGRAQKLNWIE